MKSNLKEIDIKSKGYYSLSVKKADGSYVEDKHIPVTNNVITYDGAAALVENNYMFSFYSAVVGTGTTELTRSSTGLGTQIAQSATDSKTRDDAEVTQVDNLDGTMTITVPYTMTFDLGEVTGTISEVGVFRSSFFIAGQLIKDDQGNPTTITLLSDEQLIVNYTLEWTVPNESQLIGSGTVDADGVSTDYEIWAQPYFADYTVTGVSSNSCYGGGQFSSNDEVTIWNSAGTTNIYSTGDTGDNWNITHNGTGQLTYTCPTISFGPSDFADDDVAFIGVYTFNGSNNDNQIVDTTNVLHSDGQFSTSALILKFDPAIDKTATKSLSFDLGFTLNV